MSNFIDVAKVIKEPEARNGGVVTFPIAIKRTYKDKATGEYTDDIFNCVAFSAKGEYISQHIHKGDTVKLEGNLQNNSYTDKDGNKRSSVNIVVSEVRRIGSKKPSEYHSGTASAPFKDSVPATAPVFKDDTALPFDL